MVLLVVGVLPGCLPARLGCTARTSHARRWAGCAGVGDRYGTGQRCEMRLGDEWVGMD